MSFFAGWIPDIHLPCSQDNGDPDDLWDFGTVRHGRPGTIGKAGNANSFRAPPLTWENDGRPTAHDRSSSPMRSSGSGSSGGSYSTAKGELPPLPAANGRFQQTTVRHVPLGMEKVPQSPNKGQPQRRQPSDDYEDYGDQYVDSYSSSTGSALTQGMQNVELEEDLPDTTMLDSVVLPAIASVRHHKHHHRSYLSWACFETEADDFGIAVPSSFVSGGPCSTQRIAEGIYRSGKDYTRCYS